MGKAILVLGNSGRGKTASLRNMDPESFLYINILSKDLPFKASWKKYDKETNTGTVINTSNVPTIIEIIKKSNSLGRKIIVIDDTNYIMSNHFMKRISEKGYDKFSDMAKEFYDLFDAIKKSEEDLRVFVFAHTQENSSGETSFKTIGKLVDEKISIEGLATIVLGAFRTKEGYFFQTQTRHGFDTCKSPMGMFEEENIDNDLNKVIEIIDEYYE